MSEQQDELHLEHFDRLIYDIEFDFYHSAKSSYSFIKNVKNISDLDKRWVMGDKLIASHAPFLQGCIQIMPKNKSKNIIDDLNKQSIHKDSYKLAETVI